MATEKRTTPKGNSYWTQTGAYQDEYNTLCEKLVPSQGHAPTVNGEIIRCASRLFHDYCNNGNCNAIEQTEDNCPFIYDTSCDECYGSGTCESYENGEEGNEIECAICGGSGTIQEEESSYIPEVNAFFDKMARQIESFVLTAPLDEWRHFIKTGPGYSNYTFDAEEMDLYNRIMDEVMHYVLNNEDKPLPAHMQFMK